MFFFLHYTIKCTHLFQKINDSNGLVGNSSRFYYFSTAFGSLATLPRQLLSINTADVAERERAPKREPKAVKQVVGRRSNTHTQTLTAMFVCKTRSFR